jgi:antitoxin component YwqK of YwqJK toxin-antitoxin module
MITADYRSYFENGKKLCEGKLVEGDPIGTWKFYDVAGTMINEVKFPGIKDTIQNQKPITGYFTNGKLRCKGTVNDWESGYDCSTHQDKTNFDIKYTDAWTYDGIQILKSGTGKGIFQDENGNRIFSGEYLNYKEEGLWKYYDRNQKLHATGKYKNGIKDGLWYYGDLENLNFEDGACFDANDKDAQKKFQQNQKELKLKTELYKDGNLIEEHNFETDLNKEIEYRKRRRHYYHGGHF